jgi:hypothetical protein
LHHLKVYGTIVLPNIAGYEMKFRYTPLFVGLLIGVALGLLYGWVIQPNEPGETSPHSLQDPYRADIVLMVAEIFAAEDDVELARQRMTALGLESYVNDIANALNYAKAHDFSDQDIDLLSNLAIHFDVSTPQSETRAP